MKILRPVSGVAVMAMLLVPAVAQNYSDFVEVPEGDWTLVQDEGADLAEGYCTGCHSAAPIVQHEGFDRDGWEAEIKKMQIRYGAYVDDSDTKALAAYLTKNYGASERVHWSPDPSAVARD